MQATPKLMPHLCTFGEEAQRIASRCRSDVPIVVFDGTNCAEVLAEVVSRQRRGKSFLVMPIIEDSMNFLTRTAANLILTQVDDLNRQREAFEALASGQLVLDTSPIAHQSVYTREVLSTMREIVHFGDGLFTRSITEQDRIQNLLNYKRAYVAIAPLVDPSIPPILPIRDANRVLVWAPHMDACNLGIYFYALGQLKKPALIVCRGSFPGTIHEFVEPACAEPALRESAVIIDTQMSDPGTAIAFAAKGYSIVAAAATGAHEYVQGLQTYRMHDFTSINAAVSRARATRTTALRFIPDVAKVASDTIEIAQPRLPENPPLVSIILPTYNRPRDLRWCLEAFTRQTYPNFEVIVVNDCGLDVSDIVARYPFARYLTTPRNLGFCDAINYALEYAEGELIAQVADDDRDYPKFISSLAAALVSSGVDVAHGDIVMRMDRAQDDGSLVTYGHRLDHDSDHDAFSTKWGSGLHQQGFMVRRESYRRIGFMDSSAGSGSDLDAYYKLSKLYDFAHVTNVVGEQSVRNDKSTVSSRVGVEVVDQYRSVIERHAGPLSGYPLQRMLASVDWCRQLAERDSFFSPNLLLEIPIEVCVDTD